MSQMPLPFRLAPQARFSSFFPADRRAAEVLHRLQNLTAGEVVWIWGANGTGKSHLLQATAAHWHRQGRRVMYLDLAETGTATALAGLEALDVVLLDSLDHLLGEPQGERALFRLYNELLAQAGALVIAAQAGPAELVAGLPDLASRLAAAMVYRLPSLDDAAQLEVLQLRAEQNGLQLDDAAARYLVNRVDRDMASLCGWLDTLDKASLASQRSRLSIPFIRGVLQSSSGLHDTD